MPCELERRRPRSATSAVDLAGEPGELAVAVEPVDEVLDRDARAPAPGRPRSPAGRRPGWDRRRPWAGQREREVVAVAVDQRAAVGGEGEGPRALLLAAGLELGLGDDLELAEAGDHGDEQEEEAEADPLDRRAGSAWRGGDAARAAGPARRRGGLAGSGPRARAAARAPAPRPPGGGRGSGGATARARSERGRSVRVVVRAGPPANIP